MPATTTSVDDFRTVRAEVLGRIADACARVGRDPSGVQLVAISKTVDAERIRAAIDAGFLDLGENRVQEAETKVPSLPGAHWDLVGPLQSNKAKRALETFDRIQSIDSVALAERLDRLARDVRGASSGRRYPVLVQVNVDDDPSKAGFAPEALDEALEAIASLDALEVQGLMTIGRLVTDPEAARPTFVALRALSEGLRGRSASLGAALSMGMTDDFETAVEEGATIVRVGRAIFGERPHVHGPGGSPHVHAAGECHPPG